MEITVLGSDTHIPTKGKKAMVCSGDIGPTINKEKFIKFCQNADLLMANSKGGPS